MRALPKFMAGFVASFALFQVSGASAAWQHITAIECQPKEWDFTHWTWDGGGVQFTDPSTYGRVYCPMHESDTFNKANVNAIGVYGEDRASADQVLMYACVNYWGSTGGTCGTVWQSGVSFLGQFGGQPSLAQWQSHPYDFGMVLIQMPGPTSNGYTTIHGITIFTP